MSGPPGNAGLARVLAQRWMTETIQIEHTPRISDGRGGQLPGTVTSESTVAIIRAIGNAPQEQAIADRVSGRSVWIIEVPLGTAINAATDRIVHAASGRTFEIIQALSATHNVTLPVACVEAT